MRFLRPKAVSPLRSATAVQDAHGMIKHLKWILLLLAAVLAVLPAKAGESEPSYQGRSFSEWASQIDFTEPIMAGKEPPAIVAIRHIGTNAIPILLNWICDQKPPKGESKQDYKPPLWYSPSRVEAAAMIFNYLGAEARPAIPQLTKFALTFRDYKRYDECVRALAYIGDDSLPAFNTLLTKGHSGVQFSALEWLPTFHSNAVVVMPAVLKLLIGNDEEVGDKAVSYFFVDNDIPHSLSIPALANALPHASAKARVRICRCFFFMSAYKPLSEQPFDAVPALRLALKDKNTEVSNTASNALASIESYRGGVPGR